MKKTYSTISIILLFTQPFFAQGSRSIPGHGNGYPYEVQEDPAKRDQYAKHYQMPDGSVQAVVSNTPVHYLDVSGHWQDINTGLELSGNGTWHNSTNSFVSSFPATLGDTNGISAQGDGNTIRMGIIPKLEAFDTAGNLLMTLEWGQPQPIEVSGNKAVYKDVFTKGDVEYLVQPGRIKHNLVLSALPASIPNGTHYLAITETLIIPGNWTLRDCTAGRPVEEATTAQALRVVNEAGLAEYNIPLPEIYEQANGTGLHSSCEGRYRVQPSGIGRYELSTLVPVNWLTDQNRQWPVVIDPTVTITGGWGGTFHDDGTIYEYDPTFYVFVANDYFGSAHRGFIQWDISSIPDTATIYNTEVRLYQNATNGNFVVDSIPINAVTLGVAPFFAYSDSIWNDLGDEPYTVFPCSLSSTNYGYYDLGPAADTHVYNRLPDDAFPIGIRMPSNSTTFRRFTSDYSMLRITYFECVGQQVDPIITGTDLSCHGDSSGSIAATATGGGTSYTYVWSGPGAFLDTVQNPTGLAAGTYTVTVYSSGTCPGIDSVTLTEPDSLFLLLDSISEFVGGHHVSCNQSSDGYLAVLPNVTGSYSYTWAGPNGYTGTGQEIEDLLAGTYHVTATQSGAGCAVTDSFTLSAPDSVNGFIQNHTDAWCPYDSNGLANAGGIGGTTPLSYLWNTGSTSSQVTGLKANTRYRVTVTDQNGCTDTASVLIGSQHELPAVELGPDTGFCIGGNILLNAGGGASSWIWNNGLTGQVQMVNALDTYAVTVTSIAGCDKSDTIVIDTIYPLPSPDLGPDINIEATTVTLDAGNYAAYLWNIGAITQQITVAVSGLYTVTVTENHGCKNSDTISVTLWPLGIAMEDKGTFSIHPNPVKDLLVITATDVTDPELNLTIVDALGNNVLERHVQPSQSLRIELSIRHLPAGYYFIHVTGSSVDWQSKFVIKQ